jgi:hypothetical protein
MSTEDDRLRILNPNGDRTLFKGNVESSTTVSWE